MSSDVRQRKLPVHNFQMEKYGNDPGIDWTYRQEPLTGPVKSEIESSLPKANTVQVQIPSHQVKK